MPHANSTTSVGAPPSSYLVALAGPPIELIELSPAAGARVIGRHEQCDLRLPPEVEKVSRYHARFDHDGSRWRVADLGSRWGTFVNGVRLGPNVEMPLSDGDLIRITPWTFAFSAAARRRGGVVAADDAADARTSIRTHAQDATRPMADAMLALLLESAAAIHAADDEKQLAGLVLDSAIRGTGLPNAALLRPVDAEGSVEVLASRLPSKAAEPRDVTFSRSLIAAAAQGVVAELNRAATDPTTGQHISQSIVQLKINSAICVPLMLGGAVAAYLYLDSRDTLVPPQHMIRPGASAFCVALGRMASLALANLKRVEMEKREAAMRAELAAAAVAQKWIMPNREGEFGPFRTIGECRPGQYVGGDFFDIIQLDANRLAVAVGDVSGKGIEASVLMTATQGFLHAALTQSGDPGAAVSQVNRFVNPRRPENKFVTLWAGVFDAAAGALVYVDAGHSYALLRRKDGTLEKLDKGGGLPIGVDRSTQYDGERVQFQPGDQVMIVSDGIIEQFGLVAAETPEPSRRRFEMGGLVRAMSSPGADAVADLLAAVVAHAGTLQLSDDATAVLVTWRAAQ
jgi:serine phosphatase RsbU (regulator of sigma subunit)